MDVQNKDMPSKSKKEEPDTHYTPLIESVENKTGGKWANPHSGEVCKGGDQLRASIYMIKKSGWCMVEIHMLSCKIGTKLVCKLDEEKGKKEAEVWCLFWNLLHPVLFPSRLLIAGFPFGLLSVAFPSGLQSSVFNLCASVSSVSLWASNSSVSIHASVSSVSTQASNGSVSLCTSISNVSI